MPDSGRPAPLKLLLATTNPAKRERLAWVFSAVGFEFKTLEPADGPGPEESGASFLDNAQLKVRYWSTRSSDWVAASDGGISIPALGHKWKSLHTARAAVRGATDHERADYLLELARGLSGNQRRVAWTEALAVGRNGAVVTSWQRSLTQARLAERLDPSRLRPGFWAASLCEVDTGGRTLAELSDAELARFDRNWASLRRAVQAWRSHAAIR